MLAGAGAEDYPRNRYTGRKPQTQAEILPAQQDHIKAA